MNTTAEACHPRGQLTPRSDTPVTFLPITMLPDGTPTVATAPSFSFRTNLTTNHLPSRHALPGRQLTQPHHRPVATRGHARAHAHNAAPPYTNIHFPPHTLPPPPLRQRRPPYTCAARTDSLAPPHRMPGGCRFLLRVCTAVRSLRPRRQPPPPGRRPPWAGAQPCGETAPPSRLAGPG